VVSALILLTTLACRAAGTGLIWAGPGRAGTYRQLAVVPEAVDADFFDPARAAPHPHPAAEAGGGGGRRQFAFVSVFKWEHRKARPGPPCTKTSRPALLQNIPARPARPLRARAAAACQARGE
jgi:hypothetical protein